MHGISIPSSRRWIVPPLIALTILAIPPILAGAYSGLESVDRAPIDAQHIGNDGHRRVAASGEIASGARGSGGR